MQHYKIKKYTCMIYMIIIFLSLSIFTVNAESEFDPDYYACTYEDVVRVLGTDPKVLYEHYLEYGISEGRLPYLGAEPGAFVDGIAGVITDDEDEFIQAYNVAVEIVKPYANLTREKQLRKIMWTMLSLPGSYSMRAEHYNDPYGYFILQVASCAGNTRAIGLCLNILGIPYEHVNENQYKHQWCRVEVDGVYWICDEFGLYCGPEPAPYEHPHFR